MACNSGPDIIEDGLVLCLDAANINSYPKSGTTWSDLAGANDGTLTNGPTFDSDNGGSFVFDGTNDYINVPINLNISEASISAWVFSEGVGKNFFVYTDTYSTSNYSHCLGISSSNKLHVYMYDGSIKRGDGSATMQTNKWHNIVLAWKNSSYVKSYLDGSLDKTFAINNAWSSGARLYLGASTGSANPANGFLNGKISNLIVHTRALTADEIRRNYEATVGRYT
jgi:hypothetical protein